MLLCLNSKPNKNLFTMILSCFIRFFCTIHSLFLTFTKELLPHEELLRYQHTCINLVLTFSNKVDISTNYSTTEMTYFWNVFVCFKNVRQVKEINLKSWEQIVKILLSHWGKYIESAFIYCAWNSLHNCIVFLVCYLCMNRSLTLTTQYLLSPIRPWLWVIMVD